MRLKSSTFETERSDNIVDNITKVRGMYDDTFQVCTFCVCIFTNSTYYTFYRLNLI